MRILGIDPSLVRTGVAVIDNPPTTAHAGIIESTGHRGDSLTDRDTRLEHITAAVLDHRTPTTALAVIESGAFSRVGGSNWDRAGLWWRIVTRLHHHDIPVVAVPPTVLKKWATGRGNADKSDVAVAVARLWPDVDAPSNDAWDALALATIAAQHLGWPVPARAHHAGSLTRIDWPTVIAA